MLQTGPVLTIAQPADAGPFRATGAAKESSGGRFDAVPDNPAGTVAAYRRQNVDGAFETVERVGGIGHGHRERLVVFVPAMIATRHVQVPLPGAVVSAGRSPGRMDSWMD